MNLPEDTQNCSEHNDRMNTLICLNKPCTTKALFCLQCHQEKHSKCNINLIVSLNEIMKKVTILNSTINGGQYKNSLMKIVKMHEQAVIKRFVNWINSMLKVFDKISHEDLLNPLTIELIKSSFNIELKEEEKRIELRSRLESCDEEKMNKIFKAIDKRIEAILSEFMTKVEGLRSLIKDMVANGAEEEEEAVIEENTWVKIEKLKTDMNEVMVKNNKLEEALKAEKNRAKEMAVYIDKIDKRILENQKIIREGFKVINKHQNLVLKGEKERELKYLIYDTEKKIKEEYNEKIEQQKEQLKKQKKSLNKEKNKIKELEIIIDDNKETLKDSLKIIKKEHETKLNEQETLLNEQNSKLEDLKTIIDNDKEIYMKLRPDLLKNALQYWRYSDEINAVEDGDGILFKTKDNIEDKYWRNILYTVPLDRHSKFKITFKSIDEMDKTFLIYLSKNTDNENKPIWKDDILKYSNYYFGCNNANLLEGTTATDSPTDPKLFDVGKEYFIELWPGDKLRYYNEEGTLDKKKSFENKKEPFYLRFVQYSCKTSFTVERLI